MVAETPGSEAVECLMEKKIVSNVDLFVLLDREFQRRRIPECRKCQVSLPFRVARGSGDANWDVVMTHEGCPLKCDAVLEEIAARYKASHDLEE